MVYFLLFLEALHKLRHHFPSPWWNLLTKVSWHFFKMGCPISCIKFPRKLSVKIALHFFLKKAIYLFKHILKRLISSSDRFSNICSQPEWRTFSVSQKAAFICADSDISIWKQIESFWSLSERIQVYFGVFFLSNMTWKLSISFVDFASLVSDNA